METERSSGSSFGKMLLQAVLLIGVLLGAAGVGRLLRSRGGDFSNEDSGIAASDSHATGRLLYTTYCQRCHGADGRGDSDSIARLTPPPRDFTEDRWRFSKNQQEISRVISVGIPGTAMPAMGSVISSRERSLVAEYVLELSSSESAVVRASDIDSNYAALRGANFSILENPTAAPELEYVFADGTTGRLSEQSGRYVLINFWGTTCHHCVEELPRLADLQKLVSTERLICLCVCIDAEDGGWATDSIAEHAGFRVASDADGLAALKYGVSALPTFVLVDRRQRIIARRTGALNWDEGRIPAAFQSLTMRMGAGD